MKRGLLSKALAVGCTLLALVLYFQACGPITNFETATESELNSGSADLGSSDLQTQALQVLNQNCASCHNAQTFTGTAFTYADNLNQLALSNYVSRGNPDDSLIYQRIVNGTMPPGSPLSSDKAHIIADWIQSLAPLPTPPTTPSPSPSPTPTPVANPSATPTPAANPMAKYSYLSQNIFVPRCKSCHGSGGGFNVTTYNGTIRSLAKGMPDTSLLYRVLDTGAMPKGGMRLSAQELKAVYDWILAGAPNN